MVALGRWPGPPVGPPVAQSGLAAPGPYRRTSDLVRSARRRALRPGSTSPTSSTSSSTAGVVQCQTQFHVHASGWPGVPPPTCPVGPGMVIPWVTSPLSPGLRIRMSTLRLIGATGGAGSAISTAVSVGCSPAQALWPSRRACRCPAGEEEHRIGAVVSGRATARARGGVRAPPARRPPRLRRSRLASTSIGTATPPPPFSDCSTASSESISWAIPAGAARSAVVNTDSTTNARMVARRGRRRRRRALLGGG